MGKMSLLSGRIGKLSLLIPSHGGYPYATFSEREQIPQQTSGEKRLYQNKEGDNFHGNTTKP
jgi:hypothetical protein